MSFSHFPPDFVPNALNYAYIFPGVGSIDADSDAMKAQLADMIKSIGEQATRMAVEKMDTTTSKLIEVICKVIEQLAAAYEVGNCIQKDEICIENDEFCISNDELNATVQAAKGKGGMDGNGNLNQESIEALKEEVSIQNHEFCIQNHEFFIQHDES